MGVTYDPLLNRIEFTEPAAAAMSAASIKTAYESNNNTNEYSDSEKSKISSLESSKFLGEYVTLGDLQIAYPSPVVGSYANVDGGVGQNVKRYVWDSDDNAYVEQLGTSTILTDAQVKTQYEANANTNEFSDSEKTKLNAISGTNTGDQDISGIATNTTNIATNVTAIALNTAKNGITTGQTNAITANTAKTGITTAQANAIVANTAKVIPTLNKILTLEAPTASDDITIFRTDVAITVQQVISVSTGTTPSTTYQLKHHTDRNNAGNNLTNSSISGNTTTGNIATLSDPTIPADSFIWMETTAASGTNVYLSVDMRYTED